MSNTLNGAVFGTGFWSRFQIAAWHELEGVRITALYNRTIENAYPVADYFGIDRTHVYNDPRALLENDEIDFVDIISNVETHEEFSLLAAEFGKPVICQKPMSTSLESAERMIAQSEKHKVPLFIHENWRWQTPIRALKQAIDSGRAGKPFRATIDYMNSFPVFENQPFLKKLDQFILTDIGTHILDTARFLFGEAQSLSCQTKRIHKDILGEDVASVFMHMENDMILTCNMSYASPVEHDRFPETYVFIECENGSIELGPDYTLRVTTGKKTEITRVAPHHYTWADPQYDLVHESILHCNRNLLHALRNGTGAETSAEDNMRTLQLVYAAYDAAAKKTTLDLQRK